jgi:hypothetical protein
MDKNEVDLVKWERLERFGTIAAFLLAAISLHALAASDAVVGGAIGAASALVLPGGAASRPRAVALAGAGALVGALVGGWAPGLA